MLVFGLLILLGAYNLERKKTVSLFLLFLASFSILLFAASLDPFINLWDERFHALVAKNMLDNPFKPMLYANPILDVPYDSWDKAIVWLHKQPFFLWMGAISFKIFGVSALSFRLPNVFLGSFLSLAIFRVGEICISKKVGFLASLFFITSVFHLELLSGRQPIDQNDFAFISFISFSIWSWVESLSSEKRRYFFGIAIFAAAAILCKWALGATVYLIWGLYLLMGSSKKSDWLGFAKSVSICVVLVAPWQIFAYLNYTELYLHEQHYNFLHFIMPVEGHEGDAFFHFRNIDKLYGNYSSILIIPAFWLFYKSSQNKRAATSFLMAAGIVYLFFSIAQTKMMAYPAVVSLIIFLALASLLVKIQAWVKLKKFPRLSFYVASLIFITIIVYRLDIEGFQARHTNWEKKGFHSLMDNNRSELIQLNLPENTVLFNLKRYHYVEAMFYTEHTAYPFLPTQEQIEELEKKGFSAVVLWDELEALPAELANDSSIKVITTSFHFGL